IEEEAPGLADEKSFGRAPGHVHFDRELEHPADLTERYQDASGHGINGHPLYENDLAEAQIEQEQLGLRPLYERRPGLLRLRLLRSPGRKRKQDQDQESGEGERRPEAKRPEPRLAQDYGRLVSASAKMSPFCSAQ